MSRVAVCEVSQGPNSEPPVDKGADDDLLEDASGGDCEVEIRNTKT